MPAGAADSRYRVIVVDDDQDTMESLRELLSAEGYEVRGALGAHEGIRLALATRPHVVVIDLKLPELDGFILARSIRHQVGNSVALVAFSGWSRPEMVQRSVDVGFDDYVLKPDTEKLLQVVAHVAGVRDSTHSQRP
jgi:DNA-binding response OmpR family regulator